jgi:hypothetical protein
VRCGKNDPLLPQVHWWRSYLLISAGGYDEAGGYCEKLPEAWRRSACLSRARFWQGRTGEAIPILETPFNRGVESGAPIRCYLGYTNARAGRRADAEELLASSPQDQAMIFAGLGDRDRTFETLDRAAAAGPSRMGWHLTFP